MSGLSAYTGRWSINRDGTRTTHLVAPNQSLAPKDSHVHLCAAFESLGVSQASACETCTVVREVAKHVGDPNADTWMCDECKPPQKTLCASAAFWEDYEPDEQKHSVEQPQISVDEELARLIVAQQKQEAEDAKLARELADQEKKAEEARRKQERDDAELAKRLANQ